MQSQRITIIGLYFFLGAGALWHLLGLFQSIMKSAPPLMMALIAIILIYDAFRKTSTAKTFAFVLTTIFITSWLLEFAGTQSGAIFGDYFYSDSLSPLIFGVPFVIGFAWISTLLGSLAIISRVRFVAGKSIYIKSIAIGMAMLCFDFVMENAVLNLGYWVWEGNSVPLLNYFAWFAFGSAFAFLILKFTDIEANFSLVAFHSYLAQLIYFLPIVFI